MKEMTLADFGYAPGGYILGECKACKKRMEDVDKRTTHCKHCAQTALDTYEFNLKKYPNTELMIGGFYLHFKGEIYTIVGLGRHSETQERMVAYRTINAEYNMLWFRPAEMFCGRTPEGVPRFRMIGRDLKAAFNWAVNWERKETNAPHRSA